MKKILSISIEEEKLSELKKKCETENISISKFVVGLIDAHFFMNKFEVKRDDEVGQ